MNNPSIWRPLASSSDGVPNLAYLSGVQIPVPEDGIVVFVVDTGGGPNSGANYQLSLTSGVPLNGSIVVATSLGGLTRWIKLSGVSGVGSGNIFTYREGGVAFGNIFTSFASAYAAAIASVFSNGAAVLQIDDSIAPCVTGAAGLVDLSEITLVGVSDGGNSVLTFQTGTTVTKFRRISRLNLLSTSTAPICNLVGGVYVLYTDGFARITAGTLADFFDVSGGAFFLVELGPDACDLLNGTGAHRVIQAAAGCTVNIDAVGTSAFIGSTTLGGGGAFSYRIFNVFAGITLTQVNVTGSYTVTLFNLASQCKYIDTAPLLVPVPVIPGNPSAQEAIDALKANIQKGVATIDGVTGQTLAISTRITATSRIVFGLKTPVADAATVKYGALATDRVVGSPGSFKISALTAAGGGALNPVDASTLDWEVLNDS